MVSQTQKLLQARKSGSYSLVDSSIRRNIVTKNRGSGKSKSPVEDDVIRIIKDYGDSSLLSRVIDRGTSEVVVDELARDPNLDNFIAGVGRNNFTNAVFNLYGESNIERLLDEEIQLKTKKIRGYMVGKNIYIRRTKVGVRAFNRKTHRFAKIPKGFFKK